MASLNPIKYLRFMARVYKYSRKVKGRTSLSLSQQMLEVYRLLKLNRLEPKEYYETYELFANDLTWEEKTRYLSRNQFALLDHEYNPHKGYGLLNKLVFQIFAEYFKLPVPRMYGLFDPYHGYTSEGVPLCTVEDLEKFLANQEIKEFLFKPISTDKAQGIMVCAKQEGKLIELGQGELSVAELHQRLSGTHHNENPHVADSYLVQERLKQDPWYDRFSPDYIHNFRILTLLTSDGKVECLGGAIGIGIAGHYIHVTGPESVSAAIDENNQFKPAVRAGAQGMEYLEKHPENGVQIAGEKPPGYEAAVEVVLKAHTCIPHLRCLGWDVVPTPDGPVILEGNPYWNWEKFQRTNCEGLIRGSLAKELQKILR